MIECSDDSELILEDSENNWRLAYHHTLVQLLDELREDRWRGCEFKMVGNMPRRRVSPRDLSDRQIEDLARDWARQIIERAIIEKRMAGFRSKMRAGQAF